MRPRRFSDYQYGPEYVTSVELYARKQALEGRLGLTANVFYSTTATCS